jgi:CheY-like chemotaxis protein
MMQPIDPDHLPPFVYVVEDDEDLREIVVKVLQGAGYHTIEAANGDIAWVLLHEIPASVLFTDIIMPGALDGFMLADKAHQVWPALKVLYATGFAGTKRYSGPLHGKILAKPYRPSELITEIAYLAGAP